MGVFKGFSTLKYPVYSVITPQTGCQYDVRALNVSEVDKIKHSMVTSVKANDILNKTIWEAIESKPDNIRGYNDFLRNVTTIDREALLYGIYITTFDDKRDLQLECRNPDCAKTSRIAVLMSKMFKMNPYPGSEGVKKSYKLAKAVDKNSSDVGMEQTIAREDAISKAPKTRNEVSVKFVEDFDDSEDAEKVVETPKSKKKVKEEKAEVKTVEEEKVVEPVVENILLKKLNIRLEIANKIIAVVRQPTLLDLDNLHKNIPFAQKDESTVASETLIIERFEEYAVDGKPPMIVDDREDIVEGYNSLHIKDKRKIFKAYEEEFGKYGIDISSKWKCPICGVDDTIEIDITSHFFRMVSGS